MFIVKIPWKNDDDLLAAWRDARTGFPWIDAIMVQVRFKILSTMLTLLYIVLNLTMLYFLWKTFTFKIYIGRTASEVGLDAPSCSTLCCLLSNSWRSGN